MAAVWSILAEPRPLVMLPKGASSITPAFLKVVMISLATFRCTVAGLED